jgi:hypothetical protein
MVFSRFTHASLHLFAFLNIFIAFHVRGSAAEQFVVPGTNASLGLGYDTYWEHLTTSAAPHFVIYSDKWISGENGPPAVTAIQVCCSLLSLPRLTHGDYIYIKTGI